VFVLVKALLRLTLEAGWEHKIIYRPRGRTVDGPGEQQMVATRPTRFAGLVIPPEEVIAVIHAMGRLLLGSPLRSDGKLTVKSLAAEAGLRRNKLTHRHTALKTSSTSWSRTRTTNRPPSSTCGSTTNNSARP
jgi:hypothetical protein